MKKYIVALLILIFLLAGGLFLEIRGTEEVQNEETSENKENPERAIKFPTEFLLEKSEIKEKTIKGEVVDKKQGNILVVGVDLRDIFTNPPKAYYEKEIKILSDTFIYTIEEGSPVNLSAENINVGDNVAVRFFGDVYMIFEDIVFEAWKVQIFKNRN